MVDGHFGPLPLTSEPLSNDRRLTINEIVGGNLDLGGAFLTAGAIYATAVLIGDATPPTTGRRVEHNNDGGVRDVAFYDGLGTLVGDFNVAVNNQFEIRTWNSGDLLLFGQGETFIDSGTALRLNTLTGSDSSVIEIGSAVTFDADNTWDIGDATNTPLRVFTHILTDNAGVDRWDLDGNMIVGGIATVDDLYAADTGALIGANWAGRFGTGHFSNILGANIKDAGGTDRLVIADGGNSSFYDAGGALRFWIEDNADIVFRKSDGSTELMRLDDSLITMEVDLDLQNKDIHAVGQITHKNSATKEIVANTITITQKYTLIDSENGSGPATLSAIGVTDDVDQEVVLKTLTGSRTMTIADGTNLNLAGNADFVMSSSNSTMHLYYRAAQGKWFEMSRSSN